jgi:signal transduction histidine kinase
MVAADVGALAQDPGLDVHDPVVVTTPIQIGGELVGMRHAQEAQNLNITLRTVVEHEADQMEGDLDRLELVLDNLVSNALRHSSIGGAIELHAATQPAAIVLSVVRSSAYPDVTLVSIERHIA